MKFDVSLPKEEDKFPQIRLGNSSGRPYLFKSRDLCGVGMFVSPLSNGCPSADFKDTKLAPVGYSVTLTQE